MNGTSVLPSGTRSASQLVHLTVGADIERMPCVISLVPVHRSSPRFHDVEDYERLVQAARDIGPQTYTIILLGGDAGLRAGEIVALEWSDVDFARRQLTIQRSDWRGETTSPKGGRVRYVPMTKRLSSAIRELRHLRSRRVVCRDDGSSLRRQNLQKRVRRAARRAKVKDESAHVLRHTCCSHLAMRGAPAKAIRHWPDTSN